MKFFFAKILNSRRRHRFNSDLCQRIALMIVLSATVISLAALMAGTRKTEGPNWLTPGIFWDVAIYNRALKAVAAGMDPYAAALARQQAAHAVGKFTFSYVYPPLTLFVLRAIALFPSWLAVALYTAAYCGGYVILLWAIMQFFRPEDRSAMQYAIPLVIFFPGLMTDIVIFSGNVAYIFYGLLFAATVAGWKRGNWHWFYLAILLGACFKLPFLTLLTIPAMAGQRQWLRATSVGAAGVGIWALQGHLWPAQFHEYLECVRLQFEFNHDFGESPAGNLGRALFWHGIDYTLIPTLVFLIYGGLIFGALWYYSSLYKRGRISGESWIPVLLLGTLLLNPRIMQYDLHAFSLVMVLIVLRSVAARSKAGIALAGAVFFLIVIDLLGVNFYYYDDLRNMCVLLGVMGIAFQYLAQEAGETYRESLSTFPGATLPESPRVEVALTFRYRTQQEFEGK